MIQVTTALKQTGLSDFPSKSTEVIYKAGVCIDEENLTWIWPARLNSAAFPTAVIRGSVPAPGASGSWTLTACLGVVSMLDLMISRAAELRAGRRLLVSRCHTL